MKYKIAQNFFFVSVLFFSLSFSACDRGGDEKTESKKGEPLVYVNGKAISLEDLGMPANVQWNKETLDAALEQAILNTLLAQKGVESGIVERSRQVQYEIARAYTQEILSKADVEPTEDEIKAYFESKKSSLERVRASHILIPPADATDAALEEARKKAESLRAEIEKEPKRFFELAQKHSNDLRTSNRGGDLFFVTRSQLDPALADAIFALKNVGDLSPVVKSSKGFHIAKLTGDQRGMKINQNQFKSEVQAQKRQKALDDFHAEVKKGANIKRDESTIEKLLKTPEPQPQ